MTAGGRQQFGRRRRAAVSSAASSAAEVAETAPAAAAARPLPSYQSLLAEAAETSGAGTRPSPGAGIRPSPGAGASGPDYVPTRIAPLIGAGFVMFVMDAAALAGTLQQSGIGALIKTAPQLTALLADKSGGYGAAAGLLVALTILRAGRTAMAVHFVLRFFGAVSLRGYALGGVALGLAELAYDALETPGGLSPGAAFITMANAVVAAVSYRMFAGVRAAAR